MLINEILDLSKIESGKMSINPEKIYLSELAQTTEISFKRSMKEKGLALNMVINDNIPKSIHTDGQRVEQVIKNLMSNAIKFTEKGSITVESLRPSGDIDLSLSGLERSNAIAISVTDTGLGIAEDKQYSIFEAFQQADGSTSRKYGGTGLGLSISRELTSLLGGEIQLKSKEGEGSTFTVYLPENLPMTQETITSSQKLEDEDDISAETIAKKENFAEQHENSVAVKKIKAKKQLSGKTSTTTESKVETLHEEPQNIIHKLYDKKTSLVGKKVLVVDDDMRNAFAISKSLKERGMIVFKAANGQKALEMLEEQPHIDIVLMDIMMPIMDGYEAMQKIRQIKAFENLPVLALTAKAMQEDRNKCIQAGASDYLAKPIEIENLLSLMQVWLYE